MNHGAALIIMFGAGAIMGVVFAMAYAARHLVPGASPNSKTTAELIEYLTASKPYTAREAYNVIVGDFFDQVRERDIEQSQAVIRYFEYKITAVLLPAITQLQWQAFKAEQERHMRAGPLGE